MTQCASLEFLNIRTSAKQRKVGTDDNSVNVSGGDCRLQRLEQCRAHRLSQCVDRRRIETDG